MADSGSSANGSALVLIVDSDARRATRIAETIRRLGHRATEARSFDASVQALEAGAVDVVASAPTLGDGTGLELLELASEVFPETPFILFGAETTAAAYKSALEGGAVEVVTSDSSDEIGRALSKALDQRSGHFQGIVHGLALVDILQLLHFSRRTATVRVGPRARIHLTEGEIVHASSESGEGRDALKSLLVQRSGSVVTAPPENFEPTITQQFDALLLDLFREIDEGGRPTAQGPRATTPTLQRRLAERAARAEAAHLTSWSMPSATYVTPTSSGLAEDVLPVRADADVAATRYVRWLSLAVAVVAGTALPWTVAAHQVAISVLGAGLATTALVVAPLAARIEGSVPPILAALHGLLLFLAAAAVATGAVVLAG